MEEKNSSESARIPSGTIIECPKCGETPHRILKGRASGKKGNMIDCVVKCSECGQVRKMTIRRETPIPVKIIVSKEEKSERKEMDFLPSEELSVRDRLLVDGLEVEVSSIESGEKRVSVAQAKEISAIWTKRADRMKVKFSISKGPKTISKEIQAHPDEEFFVGDMVEIGRIKVVIHRIKCKDRVVRKGGASAAAIVRIYARAIKEIWA